MVYLRGRIAYADNVALAAFHGIAVVRSGLDFPPYAILIVKSVDKHIPNLRMAYGYDYRLLFVLPCGVEVNGYRVAEVIR